MSITLSDREAWKWYVHKDNIAYNDQVYKARDYFIQNVIPVLQQRNIPHEFVYDQIVETINIVLPADFLPESIEQILKDAMFFEKEIPQKDWQASRDMKEALLGGADFNKKWN